MTTSLDGMAGSSAATGYARVNGIDMYYQVHGGIQAGTALVLLHGALSTIETSSGAILPALAAARGSSRSSFGAMGAPSAVMLR